MKPFLYTTFFSIILFSCYQKENNFQQDNINESSLISSESNTSITKPNTSTNGEIKNIDIGCGYNYKLKSQNIYLYMPKEREINQINSILNHVGIPMNFEFYSANIDNAIATIIDDQRYIIYDPRLFNYTDEVGNTYWSSMSILAHEIGHHLSGHTLNSKNSNLNAELEADKFSGFILFKMGASIDEAIHAMSLLGSDIDSDTHPSKFKRIKAIKEGWEEANIQRYTSALPPPPSDDNTKFVVNEFTAHDILSEDIIQFVNGQSFNDYEGIIVEIDYHDPSGNYIDPYHNMVVTIELTKINSEHSGENRQIGKRYQFNLIDYYQRDRVTLSWLNALMVV